MKSALDVSVDNFDPLDVPPVWTLAVFESERAYYKNAWTVDVVQHATDPAMDLFAMKSTGSRFVTLRNIARRETTSDDPTEIGKSLKDLLRARGVALKT